jgi:hypothetical protein
MRPFAALLVLGCTGGSDGDIAPPPCPTVIPEGHDLMADVECATRPCSGRYVQNACSIELDLVACGLGDVTVRVDASGTLQSDRCGTNPAPRGAIASLDCESCLVDLFPVPRTFELPIDLRRTELVEGYDELEFTDVGGFVTDLVLLERRVFVTTLEENFRLDGCLRGNATTRLVELDPGRLEVTRSATIAGCAHRMVAHPTRPELLVLLLRASGWQLARVDLSARVLAIGGVILGDPAQKVTAIAPWAPRAEVIAAGNGELDPRQNSVFAFYGADDLAERSRYTVSTRHTQVLLPDPPNLWVGIDDGIALFAPDDGAFISETILGNDTAVDPDLSFLMPVPALDVLVGASFGAKPATFALQDGQRLGVGIFYERAAAMTTGAPWAEDPTLVLAGLHGRSPNDALLALYDPATAHFLPGSMTIGRGPVHALTFDGDRSYFALLPWEGAVLRIDLRP